ncbi:hypothetical protein QBL07_015970 [Gordonia rubripertincta]|uniref:hypothetical protein n=1 Tax=Gordonia rubripertincta TaxID=36822 RepID=UPI0039B6CC38
MSSASSESEASFVPFAGTGSSTPSGVAGSLVVRAGGGTTVTSREAGAVTPGTPVSPASGLGRRGVRVEVSSGAVTALDGFGRTAATGDVASSVSGTGFLFRVVMSSISPIGGREGYPGHQARRSG